MTDTGYVPRHVQLGVAAYLKAQKLLKLLANIAERAIGGMTKACLEDCL